MRSFFPARSCRIYIFSRCALPLSPARGCYFLFLFSFSSSLFLVVSLFSFFFFLIATGGFSATARENTVVELSAFTFFRSNRSGQRPVVPDRILRFVGECSRSLGVVDLWRLDLEGKDMP